MRRWHRMKPLRDLAFTPHPIRLARLVLATACLLPLFARAAQPSLPLDRLPAALRGVATRQLSIGLYLALLARATQLGRVLVTQDEDLLSECAGMLRAGKHFSGLIYAHQLRVTIGRLVEDLALIAGATTRDEWRGRIEYLPLG